MDVKRLRTFLALALIILLLICPRAGRAAACYVDEWGVLLWINPNSVPDGETVEGEVMEPFKLRALGYEGALKERDKVKIRKIDHDTWAVEYGDKMLPLPGRPVFYNSAEPEAP